MYLFKSAYDVFVAEHIHLYDIKFNVFVIHSLWNMKCIYIVFFFKMITHSLNCISSVRCTFFMLFFAGGRASNTKTTTNLIDVVIILLDILIYINYYDRRVYICKMIPLLFTLQFYGIIRSIHVLRSTRGLRSRLTHHSDLFGFNLIGCIS